MLNLIHINKRIVANGIEFPNSQAAYEQLKDIDGQVTVTILPGRTAPSVHEREEERNLLATYEKQKSHLADHIPVSTEADPNLYKVHVKPWMTEKSSPGFDFMQKWNNDHPMPMVVMTGKILQETEGLYLMDLHVVAEPNEVCARCGKKIAHSIAYKYGIGIECNAYLGLLPINTKAELDAYLPTIKQKLSTIKWVGWVSKASIRSLEVIE